MPTYDYECGACKKRFEIFHSIHETRTKCPDCGEPRLTRLWGPSAGFLFRGSGFYSTDYRSPDYKTRAKAEEEKTKPPAASSPSEPAKKEAPKDKPQKKSS